MIDTDSGTDAREAETDENAPVYEALADRIDQLASTVEEQQALIEDQRERLAELTDDGEAITRRGALAAGGILGLMGLGAGTASADPQGQVGTDSDPLERLYATEINAGSTGTPSLDLIAPHGVTVDVTATNVGVDGVNVDATGTWGSGIFAENDHDIAAAVVGWNTNPVGAQAYGGLFNTNSSDAHALRANGSGGGAIRAGGYVDIEDVGVSAYLSTEQAVPTDLLNTVLFDQTVVDHFDNFDTGSHQYTIPADGDYHVSTAIEWDSQFPGGTTHDLTIEVDGASPGVRRQQEVPGPSNESTKIHDHLSKTLYGLSEGDQIYVNVYHDEGSFQSISNGRADTYLTIDKVG